MREKDIRTKPGTAGAWAKALALMLALVLAFTAIGQKDERVAYADGEGEALEEVQDDGQGTPDDGVADLALESDQDEPVSGIEREEGAQVVHEPESTVDARAGPDAQEGETTGSGSEAQADALPEEVSSDASGGEPGALSDGQAEEIAQGEPTALAQGEAVATVTFYSDSSDANPRILARLLVKAEVGQTVEVDVGEYSAEPPTSEQAFIGWQYQGGVHDGQIVVDPKQGDVNLYPAFASGHWLRFSLADQSSDATYVASRFIAASAAAPGSLEVSSRVGYSFDGWFLGTLSGGQVSYGEQVSDAEGTVLDPEDLKAKLLQGDVELHAKWSGSPSTYRMFLWYENPDDEDYSFGEALLIGDEAGEPVLSGQMTSAAFVPQTAGFSPQEIEQRTVAGDGSTVVNVYYDRIEYSVYFHQARSDDSDVFPELTITAKYGADIHGLWPQHDDPDGRYTTSWYTLADAESNVFVTGIGTMPLGGDRFYPKLDTGVLCETVYRIQSVDGGDTYSDYVSVPFTTSNSPWTTPDDYMPIKGFMVNAASADDAAAIRENAVGDKLATHDSGFELSAPVDSRYEDAEAVEGSDGQLRHTLFFYYLRCQYDIVFEENGGEPIDDAEGIYYEASLEDASPDAYVEGETRRTAPNGMTYTFEGWYDNEFFAGERFDFEGGSMPAGNIVLYAKWAPTRYLVQVDPAGGEFVDPAQSTYFLVEHGSAIGPIEAERHYVADPSGQYGYDYETAGSDNDEFGEADYITVQEDYEGERFSRLDNAYSFYGWYLVSDGEQLGAPYDMNAPVTQDTNIMARWRSAGVFNIAYNPVMDSAGVTVSGDIEKRFDDGYADLSPTFVMNTPANIEATSGDTYEFLGWQVVSSFGEDAVVLDPGLYQEGDGFVVDSEFATNNTIHLQAVYEYVDVPATPPESEPEASSTGGGSLPEGGSASTTLGSEQRSLFPKTGDILKGIPVAVTAISAAVLAIALVARAMRRRNEARLDEER